MVAQEFQAVILAAGRGTRLTEVIGGTPKCLLPIGPYPLLWYPLNMLQKHNFQDAIVIVLDNERAEIQAALERTPLKLKLDLIAIPSASDFGTADSLRYIQDKIKSDFIVVSCDIVSNVCLYPLINKFRQHDATLAALLFQSGFENEVTVPGPKVKQKPERDLIGIHTDSHRLLLLAAISDYEDVMNISGHLLRKNGKITIYSRLLDSHIYIMKKGILDFLLKKENFSTLKGEFLPYIVKKQMFKASDANVAAVQDNANSETGVHLNTEVDIFQYVFRSSLEQQIAKTSLFNDSRTREPYNGDLVRCYAVEAPNDVIGVRVNTTQCFYAVNQKFSTIWPLISDADTNCLISPNAVVKSTQTKDIAVGDNAVLSEKTSLNYSIFAPNCFISPKTIITKSIIMANAVIEEGCKIEDSIIGNKAVVKKGSVLKSCLIGNAFVVEEGTTKQMQHLTNSDSFMEIDYP